MQLDENLQLWLDIFVDTIPKESVVNQLEEFQGLLQAEQDRVKELEEKLQFLVDNDSINDSSIDKEVLQLLSK